MTVSDSREPAELEEKAHPNDIVEMVHRVAVLRGIKPISLLLLELRSSLTQGSFTTILSLRPANPGKVLHSIHYTSAGFGGSSQYYSIRVGTGVFQKLRTFRDRFRPEHTP